MPKSTIDSFTDEYFFLSNFYPCEVRDNAGLTYSSTEAAFQAQKTRNITERIPFTTMSPSKAKRAGRSLHLREDWEVVKDSIMEEFIYQKFSKKEFKDKLLATGLATLIEGNTWNDTYWGVCNGVGLNHLGKILMKVRGALYYQNS